MSAPPFRRPLPSASEFRAFTLAAAIAPGDADYPVMACALDFLEWHQLNPHIFELFNDFCWVMLRTGRVRYSARTIVERMRWHLNVETQPTTAAPFKLSNDWTPYYVRLFDLAYPDIAVFSKHQNTLADRWLELIHPFLRLYRLPPLPRRGRA